ncbi:hypothetical protein [Azospirillum oryzae]|uniref:hypothetical protein n=1 Tax=Azospirillum oryzae TaxID=286727 RepID=UPI001178515B|nr:hypothetical protein [Azospirillum oryzae]
MTDITMDFEQEQVISAAAALKHQGGGRYELLHGIHVYDAVLDRGWMHYRRDEARGVYHPDVKHHVLDLLHECTRILLDRYRPAVVVCRTEEQLPLGEFPLRFRKTVDFLTKLGYRAGPILQDIDRRWSWEHRTG